VLTDAWLLFIEGMVTGVTLTLMVGPVTMVILRHGLIINRKAGLAAATGTWVSDFIFIAFTYWMTQSIQTWAEQPGNKVGIYALGGFGLLIMGIVLARSKQKASAVITEVRLDGYFKAFLAGFVVNSLSPFTLFFWLGAAALLHMQSLSPVIYYAGLMLTLGMGDFIKAWYAPNLTRWIKSHQLYWVQLIAGVAIAVTGLIIIGKGLVEFFNS
jgi:threonine/homoserine/homoserine lactone efflux protein